MPKDNSLLSFNTEAHIKHPSVTIYECGLRQTGTEWCMNGVRSPFWRLYYNMGRGNHVRVQGERIELGPERIVLLPAGLEFDSVGLVSVWHFWIHFATEPSFAFHVDEPIILKSDDDLRYEVGKATEAHHGAGHAKHAQRVYHTCAALLHHCIAQIEIRPQTAYPPTLNRILLYIRDNPAADLSNATLAIQAGMSREGFIRWFTAQTGTSPGRTVTLSRIEHGGQLLALTDQSIDAIAEASGFANRYYFTRVFSRHKGCGPAEFRRRNRSTL